MSEFKIQIYEQI